MAGKSDLTTLLSAHLAVLRAAGGSTDASTVLAKDVVTMEATQARANSDTNADYYVYLQTHS